MSFRLLIECSKDIDSLKINFSDGTSVINQSNHVNPETEHNTVANASNAANETEHSHVSRHEELLDFNDYDEREKEEVIELPNIDDTSNREVKVAEELQNLDI